MNKKKLIRKIAVPVAIVFVASIICSMAVFGYMNALYEDLVEELNAHISELTDQNQKYLDGIAQKIQEVAEQVSTKDLTSTQLVQKMQSEFLKDHQMTDRAKRYLWMNDPSGEFVFGAPASVFIRLNAAFDQQKELLTKDGLFRDRNAFLTKVVESHHKFNFDKLDINSLKKLLGLESSDVLISVPGYRKDSWYYTRERSHLLSSPIIDQAGTVLGTLFLKVDDSVNHKLYYTQTSFSNDGAGEVFGALFAALAVISGLFLWFLIPTWVYIDAQQRDIRNPGIWAFFTIISTVFGLAIYFITRPSVTKSFHCPQCENEVNGGAFCPFCGFDLSSTMCPQCQYPIKPEWAFCPSCRTELREKREVSAKKEEIEPEKEKN